MVCKNLDECPVFNFLQDNPQKMHEVMEQYCKNDFESCARYKLAKVVGTNSVPLKLFPDMMSVADQIIRNTDKKRKSQSSKSVAIFKSLQPQDIFDFALDLLTESTEIVLSHSYRVRDQSLRKFSAWLNTELQNYYARIIHIKIKFTGVRSRKRGKNPLTFFLENIRRGKSNKDTTFDRPTKLEEICEPHFASMTTRIALFKGLKSKPLNPEIVEAIDAVLELEERQLDLGAEYLIKRFNEI